MKKLLPVLVLAFLGGTFPSGSLHAQSTIKGQLVDVNDTSALYGAVIVLRHFPDSTLHGDVADTTGQFEFSNLPVGSYKMTVRFASFVPYQQSFYFDRDTVIDLGVIPMSPDSTTMDVVRITTNMIRVVQKNDTIEMNAAAFKTNPDASAEDLVAKMPGIQVVNGEVKAQGETVQKVLIDGKEYFGEDPSSVLKNMPADMVEKIQVFDQKSDQAIFSGVDDGNTKKTLNIVTKNQYSNATFGKAYAGYGTEEHYQAGIVLNDFRGDQKFTLLGNFNNVNQVNFSAQDLSGVSGGPSRGGYRRGNDSPFMIGKQNGVTTVNSFGFNYANRWGKKWKVAGSYFFSESDNSNSAYTNRIFYAPALGNTYVQNTTTGTYNLSHRANMRLEYKPDSVNSFLFTPKFSYQLTDYSNVFNSSNYYNDTIINSSYGENASVNTSWNLSGSFDFSHRFNKPGRTLSFELEGNYTDRVGTGELFSRNTWYDTVDSAENINQNSSLDAVSWQMAPSISWSEKAGKFGVVSFSYEPEWAMNVSDKLTMDFDSLASDYIVIDTAVSSHYNNYVTKHEAEISYRLVKKDLRWVISIEGSQTELMGDAFFPDTFSTQAVFHNITPRMFLFWKKGKKLSLRAGYRTSTNVPSITQLQNVVDNSNPLSLVMGNPYLDQSYSHTIFTRFTYTNPDNASSLFWFVTGTITSNYIGSSLLIAGRDTTLENGITLSRGGQITSPVNLQGYYNLNTFGGYGIPVAKLKSNLNINLSYSVNASPGVINGVKNIAYSNSFGGGLSVTSNINEYIDFNLGWTSSYVLTTNTNSTETSNEYYYHMPSGRVNILLKNGFVFNSDVNYTSYRGLATGFNEDFILWNAAIGYKFAPKKQCEVRVSAFDILKQNNSLARNITETYYEDVRTKVLSQYFMITFTWNIKKFRTPISGGEEEEEKHGPRPGGGGGHGGGPPH